MVLKIFLSMSCSGGLLILALLLGKRFVKDKISRQWQYYIWLVVIFRLLLPFEPEVNLLGKVYQAIDQSIIQMAPLQQQPSPLPVSGDILPATVNNKEYDYENTDYSAENLTAAHPFQDIVSLMTHHIWLIWLVIALVMLIRKVTIYQGFIRYIQAGLTPISDMEMLDWLSIAAGQINIKKPIELCVNPLVSSPLLTGFFHPCIVLPSTDISEQDFFYTVLHELIHYKRWDMFYKWLVQVTVCLHWFNPLVYWMSREITKACEFSCDEAVLIKAGGCNAPDYGNTLLNAMAAIGNYKENPGAVTLSGNKQLLKERLGAIMNFKKKSTAIRFLTGVLTLCVIFSAAFAGVYSVAAASDQTMQNGTGIHSEKQSSREWYPSQEEYSSQAEQYYEAGNVLLFQIVFPRLDEKAQEEWLDKIYKDKSIAFAGAAIPLLGEDNVLVQRFAEKAYNDGDIAFFSVPVTYMSKDTLEIWLDKALEDKNWVFQSVLFNTLDRDDEFDEQKEKWEKEWDEAQRAAYQAVGVTIKGKDFYYQGQLVNIFLDVRTNKSFYTLNMNPAGKVNVKIIRNVDNKITGAACMTETEVAELLGSMNGPDE